MGGDIDIVVPTAPLLLPAKFTNKCPKCFLGGRGVKHREDDSSKPARPRSALADMARKCIGDHRRIVAEHTAAPAPRTSTRHPCAAAKARTCSERRTNVSRSKGSSSGVLLAMAPAFGAALVMNVAAMGLSKRFPSSSRKIGQLGETIIASEYKQDREAR